MNPITIQRKAGPLWKHMTEQERNSFSMAMNAAESRLARDLEDRKRRAPEIARKRRWETGAYMTWFKNLRDGQKVLVRSPWDDGRPWDRGGRIHVGTVYRRLNDDGTLRHICLKYRNRFGNRHYEIMRGPSQTYKQIAPMRGAGITYTRTGGERLTPGAKPWVLSSVQKRRPELRVQ